MKETQEEVKRVVDFIGAEGVEDFVSARDGGLADNADIAKARAVYRDADTAVFLRDSYMITGPGVLCLLDQVCSKTGLDHNFNLGSQGRMVRYGQEAMC